MKPIPTKIFVWVKKSWFFDEHRSKMKNLKLNIFDNNLDNED